MPFQKFHLRHFEDRVESLRVGRVMVNELREEKVSLRLSIVAIAAVSISFWVVLAALIAR